MKKRIVKLSCIFSFVMLMIIGEVFSQRIITLSDVKAMALENNRNIHIAHKNRDAAKAAKSSADASNKPTVEASAFGLYLTAPLNSILPTVSANGSVSVSQIVYAGNKITNSRKLASKAIDFQEAQIALTEDEVLLNTETAYWTIVNIKQKIALADKSIALLDLLHRNLKNRFDAGLIYKNDLLKVEVQRNEAALNLVKVNDGLTLAKLNLAQIIGLKEKDFDIDGNIEGNISMPVNTEDVSIEQRPEMTMLAKRVEMEEFQKKVLEGESKPTISLSANGILGYGKNMNFATGANDMEAFAGLVSVSIPIFDWGGRKQKVNQQSHKIEAQKLEREETAELIKIEIKSAHLNWKQSIKRIALAEESLKQAEENLRLNQDRLEAGTVIGEDVLEAQILWFKSYTEIIDAKTECRINEAKYKKAIGEY